MNKIKNIFVLTVLVSSLSGCWESHDDINPDTSEVTVNGPGGVIVDDGGAGGDDGDDGGAGGDDGGAGGDDGGAGGDDGGDDGGAQIVESADEPAVSPLGNDIVSVTIVKDDTNLVISQIHKAAKDPFFSIRVYLTVDGSDTITTPIPLGAASLTGLVAEHAYAFEYSGEGAWVISRQFVSNGIWIVDDTITAAIATGGDTELTTMTIPLSEIGNPSDSTPIKMMFVATGNAFATDQAPNGAMYEFTNELSTDDPIAAVPEIVESDDVPDVPAVSNLGNDIVSISIANDGTNLVISDVHKAAKSPFFSTRVYLTVDGSDTISTPAPGGAGSLTGLVAEHAYIFEYNGAGFNISHQFVSNGIWMVDDTATIAMATGGDTELTTMTIPLSEIGSPAVGSTVQLMVVDTGNGFETDQAPNDAMYQYVVETPSNEPSTDDPIAAVPEIVESADVPDVPAVSNLGNDIVSISIANDGANLVISDVHKAAKGPFFSTRVYLTVDGSDTITTPAPGGAGSLTGLVAEHAYIFEYNGEGFNISHQFVSNGIWMISGTVTTAMATGGDTELITMTIPLNEIGNPAVGSTVQMMVVDTGNGFETDQAPNDAMYQYVVEAP